jgi:hypothetical protein
MHIIIVSTNYFTYDTNQQIFEKMDDYYICHLRYPIQPVFIHLYQTWNILPGGFD